ncbi:hypothetical protein [Variovorax sp. E3]|uniref:hypothetical protein n=1 Tax=Variovorax sp. E3 TaxID=1914993 RepID=UPI0018DD8C8D|nr:hypothetical protein [Variovorax sp. E3]
MKRLDASPCLLSVLVLLAPSVQASGHLPLRQAPPESFASFDACVDRLRQLHAQDKIGADKGPQPIANGATREKIVDTKGVVIEGSDAAHYNAEVGWSVRSPGGDAAGNRWIQSNYTFERWAWTCSGTSLSGTMEGGFTSPSFEPLR